LVFAPGLSYFRLDADDYHTHTTQIAGLFGVLVGVLINRTEISFEFSPLTWVPHTDLDP